MQWIPQHRDASRIVRNVFVFGSENKQAHFYSTLKLFTLQKKFTASFDSAVHKITTEKRALKMKNSMYDTFLVRPIKCHHDSDVGKTVQLVRRFVIFLKNS